MIPTSNDDRTSNPAKPEQNNTPPSDEGNNAAQEDPSVDPSTRAESDRDEVWNSMAPDEKMETILAQWTAEEWSDEDALDILTVFYHNPITWMRIKARAKQIGVNTFDLDSGFTI